MTTEVREARSALRRSAAVRAAVRGKPREHRDVRLQGCLDELTAAREPLTALLRSGSHLGRASRYADERAASAAIQAERTKVRGMLRRASGGRKHREPYRFDQFKGLVGWAAGEAKAADDFLSHALPQYQRGTAEYRTHAREQLERIDRVQRKLTPARIRADYWFTAEAWGPTQRRHRSMFKTAESVARDLSGLRERAKRAVAVPIRVQVTTTAPAKRPPRPPQRRRRWTKQQAHEALVIWTAENGRAPKVADLAGDAGLPSYGKVHALFDGLPDAAYLLDEAAAYKRGHGLTILTDD